MVVASACECMTISCVSAVDAESITLEGRQILACCEENSVCMQQVRVFCIRGSWLQHWFEDTFRKEERKSREETEKTQRTTEKTSGKPHGMEQGRRNKVQTCAECYSSRFRLRKRSPWRYRIERAGELTWVALRKLGDVAPSSVVRTNNMLWSWDSQTNRILLAKPWRRLWQRPREGRRWRTLKCRRW